MKTNAEKQAARRTRLSHDGLFKRRDFWLHPDDEPKLRELETQMREERINTTGDTKMKKLAIYTKAEGGSITFKGVEHWPSAQTMLEDCCRDDYTPETEQMLGWPDEVVIWHSDVGYAER
jgi:hypothetical protein